MEPLPSGLPAEIAGDEDLARFLFSKSHYSSEIVKPAAFLPSPKDQETSVSRHGPDPSDQLWSIGSSAAGGRTLRGAAIIKAKVVNEAGLEVHPDEPPPRHAAIRGWTWIENDPELQKAQQKAAALELSSSALKFLHEEP